MNKIPFLNPDIEEADLKAAVEVYRSGWLTYGPVSRAFEESFSKYLGCKDAALMTSGSAALHSMLAVAGIKPGDEVITTPLSALQTTNAILAAGAIPVFADVDPKTGLLDIKKAEAAITKKTRAIIPVHLNGAMVDPVAFAKLAKKHNLIFIEDAAHAIEADYGGVTPGQKSYGAAFSFHAAKNMTAGQGGAVVTMDPEMAKQIRIFCDSGMTKKDGARRMVMWGWKYPMTSFQAAMLSSQLKRIEKNWKKRHAAFERYAAMIDGIQGVSFPQWNKGRHAHHMFVVWVDPKIRDSVRAKMGEMGVETSVHYDPIHLEPYYVDEFKFKPGMFPVAEKLGFGTISLPLYPSITAADQKKVVTALREALS